MDAPRPRHPINRRHRGTDTTADGRSVGERAADAMRNGMGSWAFVFAALAFLFIWMGYNRGNGFDPYPFILLNLTLSCLAAMQGAILLIAAKRQDAIASALADHDFRTDRAARIDVALLVEIVDNLHQHVTGEPVDRTAIIAEIRQRVDQELDEPVPATKPLVNA